MGTSVNSDTVEGSISDIVLAEDPLPYSCSKYSSIAIIFH